MSAKLALAALTASMVAIAPARTEDAAHRLDRMQTRLLNARAAARLAAPGRPILPSRDEALRLQEDGALARWQARSDCAKRSCPSPSKAPPPR